MISFCQRISPSGRCPVETATRISGSVSPQAAPIAEQRAEHRRDAAHAQPGSAGASRPPSRTGTRAARAAGGVVGLDEDAAERRRALGRGEAALGHAGDEAGRSARACPCRSRCRSRRTCRRRSGRRCRASRIWVSAVGTWVWVPTTRLARPSHQCPSAIFSEVASACTSTITALRGAAERSPASAPRRSPRTGRRTAAS